MMVAIKNGTYVGKVPPTTKIPAYSGGNSYPASITGFAAEDAAAPAEAPAEPAPAPAPAPDPDPAPTPSSEESF